MRVESIARARELLDESAPQDMDSDADPDPSRSHDRYRDLRAWLNTAISAHAANQHDQDRHVMTMVGTSRCPNARPFPRSSIGEGGACLNAELGPQFVRRSTSLNATGHDRSRLLIYRNAVDQQAEPCCLHPVATFAAIKSP
jgi:hypothetical protein